MSEVTFVEGPETLVRLIHSYRPTRPLLPRDSRSRGCQPVTKTEVQPRRLPLIIVAVSGRLHQFIRWLGTFYQAGFVSFSNPSIDLRILRDQVAVRPLDNFDFITEPNGDLVYRGASTSAPSQRLVE